VFSKWCKGLELNLDVDYDHRLDSEGKDPDTHSPTLKLQHQLLWSKPLPDGTLFDLQPEPGKYLKHNSRLGEFFLSSDTISHSLRNQKRMQPVIEQIPSGELDEFQTTGSVIGGRILFPGNRIDGQATINSARGFNSKINDRFDLTLECIRLHYQGVANPLDRALNRYSDFFRLFKNFQGYVEFFFLQDLVNEHSSEVNFFLTHDPSFEDSPRPANVEKYMQYKANTTTFIRARNQRIDDWIKSNHFRN
jgi:hypothetical protein